MKDDFRIYRDTVWDAIRDPVAWRNAAVLAVWVTVAFALLHAMGIIQ